MLKFITTAVLMLAPAALFAQEAPAKKKLTKSEQMVEDGLEWLKKTQAADGHWEAIGSQKYPTAMTAMAGMCFLMEGSTLREGKYSDQIAKAVQWLMVRAQPNGLIGNPVDAEERARYMYGHGFSLLFLSCVYGEEDDLERRKKLEAILTEAVKFACSSQTKKGGWGYVHADEGGQFDEGSVTITQLQALRAARNAGIPVPKENIKRAIQYLHDSTTPKGGIIYSLAHGSATNGQERAPLTAAAVACAFNAGEYTDDYAKKWLRFCQEHIPIAKGRLSHDEYQSYYYAQAIYVLGDDRYGKMFPEENKANWLTWSGYKEAMVDYLGNQNKQQNDGSWNSGYIGPVFATCVNLTILQLEKGILPIYHR